MGSLIKLMARVINVFNALVMISISNQKTMEGVAFSVRKRFTLGAGATQDIIMDATALTKDKLVFLPLGFDGIGGPMIVDIYRGATENGDGQPLPTYNRSFVIGTPPETEFRVGFTGIDITGLVPIELLLPSDGQGVGTSSGASTGDALVADIDKTEKILLRITNTGGSSATVGVKIDFFEVNI